MLHAGLDLSRKKLDVCLLSDRGDGLPAPAWFAKAKIITLHNGTIVQALW